MDRRQFLTGVAAVTAAAAMPAVATAAAHVAAPVAKAAPKAEWLPILDSTGKVCAREAFESLVRGGKAYSPQHGIVEARNGAIHIPSGGRYVFRGGPLDLTMIKGGNSLDVGIRVDGVGTQHAEITYERLCASPLSHDASMRLYP